MNSSSDTVTPHQRPHSGALPGLLLALLFHSASAASDELPDTGETKADALHGRIAEEVSTTAAWLDSFFNDENYQDEVNKTSLRVSLSSFTEAGEGTDLKFRTGLRLRLPYLENRLLLFVSGETEDLDTTDSEWEDVEDEFTGTDSDNASVGLRYFFKETVRSNASLSGGLRFRSGSPVVYVQPRYRYTWDLSDWGLRFIQKFSWYSDSGFDSRSELQLERALANLWFFRTTAQLDWYEDEDGVFPQLNFDWSRPLSERRVISLQWNNYFETEPRAVLSSSVLKARYRQQVWRRWLRFEMAPQIAFPQDEGYDASPGIFFKLEAEFHRAR